MKTPPPTSGKDRRAHDRYPLKIPARLTFTRENGEFGTAKFKTENISAGGALIQTDKTLETGARVSVHLVLPMDRLRQMDTPSVDVSLSGRIIRVAGSGAVIEFDPTVAVSRHTAASAGSCGPALSKLTPREQEILDLIARGAPNKDIARSLSIGLSTVKSHIYSLYKKIGVKNRFQAILWRSHNG